MKSLEASEARTIALLEFEDDQMIETTHVGIGIDTPEDLERLEECFSTAYFCFFLIIVVSS
jgi:CMP-2-keto-3-deoxyoctulosonic acid synthetase